MTDQKIDAGLVRRSFFNTSIADIYRAIDGGSVVGAYTLLFCSLDALANVASAEADDSGTNHCQACGQRTDIPMQSCGECSQPRPPSDAGKIFRGWCERWIKKEQNQKNCRSQFLYELRCALVHAHGMGKNMKSVYGYQLQHDLPTNHWKQIPVPAKLAEYNLRPGYVLNLESLLAEYVLGAWKFFVSLESTWDHDRQAIKQRLLSLVGLLSLDEKNRVRLIQQPPQTYGQMHSALAIFDNQEEPSVEEIRFQIHEMYRKRPGTCKCESVYKYFVEEHDRKERLTAFDFDKLGNIGKQLHELIDQYADEKVAEKDFRLRMKEIAKPADAILTNFPDTELPLLKVNRNFRASLKDLAFQSKAQSVDDLAIAVQRYLMDFITALSNMLHEAQSLNIITDWTQDDLLRAMGVQIRRS